jgi:hypothetical protein
MGKPLHCVSGLLYIFVLSFILMVLGDDKLFAQLKFENFQPFELEISEVSDLANQNNWKLNPADHELIRLFGVGELYDGDQVEGHFQLQRDDGNYLGFHSSVSGNYELIRFRFENDTDRLIDRIQFGFDLAIQLTGRNNSELLLHYSYGQETGTQRVFSSSQFSGADGEWNRASISSQVNNLLLSPGEVIEFSIRIDQSINDDSSDIIALHRVEITPEEFQDSEKLNVADLVITEIFPGSVVSGERLYYLEIYNSTSEPLDLRGVTILAGGEEFRIREPLEIMPFEWAVIANRSIEHIGFDPDLILNGLYLPSHGGMIELIQDGARIMRAAYDEQSGNRSWELSSIYDVIDGYASLNQFQESEVQFAGEIHGSPGTKGITKRIFTYEQDSNREWVLFSPPGILQMIPDENDGYWTGKAGSHFNEIPAGTGILARNQSGSGQNDSVRWIAVESETDAAVTLDLPEDGNRWLLLGNPYLNEITMQQVVALNGEFESRTAQVWDPVYNTFRLKQPNDRISPWQAFIMKNKDAESIRYETDLSISAQRDPYLSGRSRSISFELRYSDNRQQAIHDHAAVLYFHESVESGNENLNAKKLWPLFSNDPSNRSSLIYFIGQQDGNQVLLAQHARPYQPEQPFELKLGHTAYNVSGQHTLRWDNFENIPDNWELTITDTYTGLSVDMREENQFTFNASPNLDRSPELSDAPGIHPVELSQNHERFIIKVDPDPALTAANNMDSTQPDRIELYQNYPNPFNPATNIRFYLPEQQSVVVGIYNVVGQRVAQLLEDVLPQGEHTIVWDATEMPSGIYIIHLEIGNRVLTRKMTLIK